MKEKSQIHTNETYTKLRTENNAKHQHNLMNRFKSHSTQYDSYLNSHNKIRRTIGLIFIITTLGIIFLLKYFGYL